MHINAKANEYQQAYPAFNATPKAVIAACAFSLALRLTEDNPEAATDLLTNEWMALYEAGIVPQKPKSGITQ